MSKFGSEDGGSIPGHLGTSNKKEPFLEIAREANVLNWLIGLSVRLTTLVISRVVTQGVLGTLR